MSKIPTIAMIPSAYKANKVYSVLPTNGDADLDFARASTRTRVNEIGLVEDLATGVPALDYSDGGCPTLLLEPQSTNLITYSEDFSDASWSKANVGNGVAPIVTVNQGTSPKGDLTADKVVFDLNGGVTSSDRSILRTLLTLTTDNHTVSFYAKTLSGQGDKVFSFNWKGGNIGTFTVTEDWQRFEYTDTGLSSGTFYGIELSGDTDSQNAEIYLWGAQIEEQSYATSYIPTSGATATRVAETLSKTGLSNYINSSEGVLYAEISALADDLTERYITLNDGSNTNVIRLGFFVNNPNEILYQVNVSGTQTSQITTSYTITDFNKIAVTWKLNEFKLFVNGTQVGSTDTSGSLPIGLDTLSFGNIVGVNQPFRGGIKDLRVYNQVLTDTELQNLTS